MDRSVIDPAPRVHGTSSALKRLAPIPRLGQTLALAALFCAAAASAQAATVDRVVATVDREAILLSDLLTELSPYIAQLRQSGVTPEEIDQQIEVRIQETLDQAINEKILLREALLAGLDISDDIVEERLTELRKLYPSVDVFERELKEAGETMSELRSRLRKQLLARRMAVTKREQLARSVTVTESDVAQYYEDNRSQFVRPERVLLRRIFLAAPADASQREVVRARAEQLRDELAAGADFAELAQAHSEGPDAAGGGLVGWVVLSDPAQGIEGDLVPELDRVAATLEEGATSDVVETGFGYLILRAEERQDAGLAELDEVRPEIEPILRNEEAGALYDKWISDLRKRSRVRVMLD